VDADFSDVAVFIPCLNEEATVARVVGACLTHLPAARVYVFDNCSTDRTAALAAEAGATVVPSPAPGKGHVVRHAFESLPGEYLLMVDGDGTYPIEDAPRLIALARQERIDMVCGARLALGTARAFRPLHFAGNVGFTTLVRALFGRGVGDVLTGYRVFSRNFVERIQPTSAGFEIETELTVRALALGLTLREISVPYAARPEGSASKLRTFRDGARITRVIWDLWREYG
jgi:glycosyltransferase involved in cell wall biosynthesis